MISQADTLLTTRLYEIAGMYISENWTLVFSVHIIVLATVALLLLLIVLTWRYHRKQPLFGDTYQIDKVSIGVGDQNVQIRPNYEDRQIAYRLWVELSTRKIGLPIDKEHDVICQVYDSWYDFFQITRELIKDIPVSKIRRSRSTQELVDLSIQVLNAGLRPHLTWWQARFRQWYDKELSGMNSGSAAVIEPQDLQRRFPRYDELMSDLLTVNGRLISYRRQLEKLWKS